MRAEELYIKQNIRHPLTDPVGRVYKFSGQDMIEFAEEFARLKWDEACEAQRELTVESLEDDLVVPIRAKILTIKNAEYR